MRLVPVLLFYAVALHVAGAAAMYPESTEAVPDPDYVAGKAAVAAGDWPRAIAALNAAARRKDGHADTHNLLGYALRNTGRTALALQHYERALALDPGHRGAREYLGELHLMQNDLAKAEEQRAALARLCKTPCEELDELTGKINNHKQQRR